MSFRTSISVLRLRAFLLVLPLLICFNAYADPLTVERLKSLSSQQLVEHCEQFTSDIKSPEDLATVAYCAKKIQRLSNDDNALDFVSLSMSESAIDVTDERLYVDFEVTISSPDIEPKRVLVEVFAPEDAPLSQKESQLFTDWEAGEAGQYTFSGTISFGRNSAPGVWLATVNYMEDIEGNQAGPFSAEDIEAAGSNASLSIANENELDIEPPRVVDIQFSSYQIDIADQSVQVDVTITMFEDQGASRYSNPVQLGRVEVYHENPGYGTRWANFHYDNWSEIEENLYTITKSFTFNLNSRPGKWLVGVSSVFDANGNRMDDLDHEALSDLGIVSELQLSNRNAIDTKPPEVLGIEINPSSIDTTNGPQTVTVTLDIEDRSGWGSVSGGFHSTGNRSKFAHTTNDDRDLTDTRPQLEFEFDETTTSGQWRFNLTGLSDIYSNQAPWVNNSINHTLYGLEQELFVDVNHDSSELPDVGLMRTPIYTRRAHDRNMSAEFHVGNLSEGSSEDFRFRLYFTEELRYYTLSTQNFESEEFQCTRYTIYAECNITPKEDWERGIIRLGFPDQTAEHLGFRVDIKTDGYESRYANNVHFAWETPYNAAAFMPDFDGDGIADIGVYRASTQQFLFKQSSDNAIKRITFEDVVDAIPIYGDFDNDEITDPGLYEPSTNRWIILNSSTGERSTFRYGVAPTDLPVPADYDGDGITDFAYKSMTTNEWKIRKSTDYRVLTYTIGDAGDLPVIGDFDDDWRIDVVVRQPETGMWLVRESDSEEVKRTFFGSSEEDIAVTGDFDGDGISDHVVRRPSSKRWFVRNSGDGSIYRTGFSAQSDDIPIVADYDGDGIADLASRRPSRGLQFVLNSSDNTISRLYFGGLASDIPIAAPVHIKMEMMNEQQQEQVVEFDENEPIDELFEATEQVLEVKQLPH